MRIVHAQTPKTSPLCKKLGIISSLMVERVCNFAKDRLPTIYDGITCTAKNATALAYSCYMLPAFGTM